jgi:purine-binding chemotaxis protein CheW
MSIDPWGNEVETNATGYAGLFAIKKSLDGDHSNEFIDRKQFIGTKVAGEEFLLSIDAINEIIMLTPITFVPNSAKYIEGVINLRGTILPVVNLRKMMGMTRGEPTAATRIIICKEETHNIRVGLLVDHITFVVALLPDSVDIASPPLSASGHDLLSGVSKEGNMIQGVLDLVKILTIAAEGNALNANEAGATDEAA